MTNDSQTSVTGALPYFNISTLYADLAIGGDKVVVLIETAYGHQKVEASTANVDYRVCVSLSSFWSVLACLSLDFQHESVEVVIAKVDKILIHLIAEAEQVTELSCITQERPTAILSRQPSVE